MHRCLDDAKISPTPSSVSSIKSRINLMVLREIDPDSYKQKKAEIDARLTQLENSLALMKAQLQREQEQAVLTATDHLTDSLDDLLIEKILVFPWKRLDICYTNILYDLYDGGPLLDENCRY